MKAYFSNQVKINRLQIKMLLSSVLNIFFQVSICICVWIGFNDLNISRLWLLIISIYLVIYISIYLFTEVKKILNTRRDWSSINIILSDESIIKEQNKKPDVEIAFNEITRIIQENGGTSIETLNSKKNIYVPNIIDEYDDFISKLNIIKSIEVNDYNTNNILIYSIFGFTIVLVIVITLLGVFYS